MKRILAGLLVFIMVCAVLTACGGNANPSATPASAAPASTAAPAANDQDEEEDADNTATGMSAEEYDEKMSAFIASFELLCDGVGELIANSESLSSEEDIIAWCQAFIAAKDGIGAAADKLAEVAPQVPEEFQESHVQITVAVAAVYDGLTGFENAVDGAINGDAAAFEDGLVEFVGNLAGASALWDEAVESR